MVYYWVYHIAPHSQKDPKETIPGETFLEIFSKKMACGLGIINGDAPFSEFPLWQVVVQAGCRGTVLAEFSDTRLTVVFETSETGTPSCFNVLPLLENTAGFVVGI